MCNVLLVNVMMLPPLASKENATAVAHPLMYATDLAVAKEALSSHITIKCMINSYTLTKKPYLQPMYT